MTPLNAIPSLLTLIVLVLASVGVFIISMLWWLRHELKGEL